MKTVYQICVSDEEVDTIHELLRALDNCPIDLTDDGYVAIMRAIASGDKETDIDGVGIAYED
jgi:hypothetical protein